MKKPLWLCDLDGTLALMNGRGPFEWDKVGEDLPNAPVIAVIQALLCDGHDMGFISGRMEQCRDQTFRWLLRHVAIAPYIPPLWMRGNDDYRPDEVLKAETYHHEIEPYYDVQGIFDDRSKVVRMWRNLGLTCFQVADGNFLSCQLQLECVFESLPGVRTRDPA
jgi:hypothetical protein